MRFLVYLLGAGLLVVLALTYQRQKEPPAFEVLAAPPGENRGATAIELPRLWALPDFNLTERSGETVGLSSLRGSVWVADFFYTSCTGPCHVLSSRFSDLQKELASETQLRFVSISSDPEKDTPAVLQSYATRLQASERWYFLTGEKAAIYSLANQGFKLSLVEDRSNTQDPIDHSTKLALVDRTGTVRGVYDGMGEEGKAKLLRDIRLLFGGAAMTIDDLPLVNASLNALSTVFIVTGITAIKRDRKPLHILCMASALVTSAVFLACYVTYHAHHLSTRFTHEGWPRLVYFPLLISHVILAVVIVPLIIMTVIPALRARYDRHRKIAAWTWPLWLYVSVTGVLVYLMLYVWFPPVK